MACRRCSECVGEEHHWIENGEFAEAGDPEFECKHCDAACAAVDDDGGFPVPSGVLMRKPIRCSEDGDENESESDDDPFDLPLFAIAAIAGSCDGCGLPIAVGEPVHHYGEVTVHAVCPGDVGHDYDDGDPVPPGTRRLPE